MAKSFIFDLVEVQCDRLEYTTVIFVEGPIVSVKDLKPEIDAHVAGGVYARKPTIIGSSYIKKELKTITQDPQFIDLFAVGDRSKPQILIFDEHGTFFEIKDHGEDVFNNNAFIDSLRRQGITTLINRNEGIIETADTFHYVKPSDRHARRFIRTADIFRDSVELSFLAIWLIPYLKEIDVIHCDTAAIFPIVQQALILREQLSDKDQVLGPIRLSSFGDWAPQVGPDRMRCFPMVDVAG